MTKAVLDHGFEAARPAGRLYNTGDGPFLQPVDIGHDDYVAVLEPDTAFWALIKRDKLAQALTGGDFLAAYLAKAEDFAREMQGLRFGLTPSAVYFNPTQRCNLNCPYCYLPGEERLHGRHMSAAELTQAMSKLSEYFQAHMPADRLPQIIFHGAEPLLNREAVFQAIEDFGDRFRFGIQTNATLLDRPAVEFLTAKGVSLGISLDGHTAQVSDRTRRTWNGSGASQTVMAALEMLEGYPGLNVICTVTSENLPWLADTVAFFHSRSVPACLMNVVRCGTPGAKAVKPDDGLAWAHFQAALEKSRELYLSTGRKLIVANFANIILAITAPTARRLMCDISPCGAGRCFFAVAANGDMFPCGEFIGLPEYRGGNLFADDIEGVLASPPFAQVKGRVVEDIKGCRQCAIRHFCGSPCPAEAVGSPQGLAERGAFCRFYEEQVRFALRLLADGQADDFLWEGWDKDVDTVFDLKSL
jgi:uncharacterized protein